MSMKREINYYKLPHLVYIMSFWYLFYQSNQEFLSMFKKEEEEEHEAFVKHADTVM